MEIKELAVSARRGDSDSIQELKNHYIEKYNYLKDEIHLRNSEELLKSTIDTIIDMYAESDTVAKPHDYVRRKIKAVIKRNSWRLQGEEKFNYTVNYIVEEAKKGSNEARKQLIEYYMYLVDYFLLKYDFDFEYEDARQLGYLFLIKKVNDYLLCDAKTHISMYLLNSFTKTFTNIIERKQAKESEYEKIKNLNIFGNLNTFDDEVTKLEFDDFFERQEISEKSRYIFSEIFYGESGQTIADDLDVSRSSIHQRNNKTKQKLKSFFEIE